MQLMFLPLYDCARAADVQRRDDMVENDTHLSRDLLVVKRDTRLSSSGTGDDETRE
jgi:hypothetical protein